MLSLFSPYPWIKIEMLEDVNIEKTEQSNVLARGGVKRDEFE
ncbi:hypothetical protein [uncultured Cyclobacterium sp.]|tara:strand:- start:106900 stop:107025 length:126 start_codon:yes stop_codon:yes gene_type:complete